MENNSYSNIVFRGYRRVFFLVFALAMLMQAAAFMQNRIAGALKLVNDDFKIVLALNNANTQQAKDFHAFLDGIKGVTSVAVIEPDTVLASLNNRDNSMSAQAVNADFLPAFFEVKVTQDVLLNPKAWVQENITSAGKDANVYYKEDQASLALYINAVNKFALIALLCAVFLLLAFGFFVEAYYTKISSWSERAGGLFSAFAAYIFSAAVAFALAYPVNAINPDFKYCLLNLTQLIIAVLCLSCGWTLAKWKKF